MQVTTYPGLERMTIIRARVDQPEGLTKAQTPLIRFVVDLSYDKPYNKSTTNPQPLDMSRCTTNRKLPASPQQIHDKSIRRSLAHGLL